MEHYHPAVMSTSSASDLTASRTQPEGRSDISQSVPDVVKSSALGTRRLSQGDLPLCLKEQEKVGSDEINFLLGRAARYEIPMIRVTEVAPQHTTIREDDSSTALLGGVSHSAPWKPVLDEFVSKKMSAEHRRRYPKRLRSYYHAQDELISAYEKICQNKSVGVDVTTEVETDTKVMSGQDLYKRAAFLSKVTLGINLTLLVLKAVASYLSGSMSILSSLIDSALDLLSGVVMLWATRAMTKRDPYTYPQGRTKLAPVSVIILSVVMALCSLQLAIESVRKIERLSRGSADLPIVDQTTIAIALSTVIVKTILWLYCRKIPSSVVQALAQDHRNDVLSNSVALLCGFLGSKTFYVMTPGYYGFAFVDPAGALLISLYIIYNWWGTGREQVKQLTGHTARPDFLSKLTWMCLNHHSEIKHIDTVRAFHFGSDFLVEVDIVLPGDMPLRQAHDIGETLQHNLESLPEVERAFVHLDYEFTHDPRSEHKVV